MLLYSCQRCFSFRSNDHFRSSRTFYIMVSWDLCESAGPLIKSLKICFFYYLQLVCTYVEDQVHLFFSIVEFVHMWKNSRFIFIEVTKSLNLSWLFFLFFPYQAISKCPCFSSSPNSDNPSMSRPLYTLQLSLQYSNSNST